jgi:hypothetical protein
MSPHSRKEYSAIMAKRYKKASLLQKIRAPGNMTFEASLSQNFPPGNIYL